ncbi:MAG: hypothetical protein AAF846_17265 [Chloroflexota bacterium]
MPEKNKRKANPRRRTLMCLIIGIGLLMALIAGAIQVLRPDGAEIIYIAPDENGVEQVWLVNLDNPENPRQLTEFEGYQEIGTLQISKNNRVFLARQFQDASEFELWVFNLYDENPKQFATCNLDSPCSNWHLHPNGKQLVYLSLNEHTNIDSIQIYEFETDKHNVVTEVETPNLNLLDVQWIDNSENLIFTMYDSLSFELSMNIFDSDSTQSIDSTLIEKRVLSQPNFSPDTSHYVYTGGDLIHNLIFKTGENNPILSMPDYFDENSSDTFASFIGWHSNTNVIIEHNVLIYDGVSRNIYTELAMYNVQNMTKLVLSLSDSPRNYGQASFNESKNLFIVSVMISNTNYLPQIYLYNLTTNEEIILPIFGSQPQWVNGGR